MQQKDAALTREKKLQKKRSTSITRLRTEALGFGTAAKRQKPPDNRPFKPFIKGYYLFVIKLNSPDTVLKTALPF